MRHGRILLEVIREVAMVECDAQGVEPERAETLDGLRNFVHRFEEATEVCVDSKIETIEIRFELLEPLDRTDELVKKGLFRAHDSSMSGLASGID